MLAPIAVQNMHHIQETQCNVAIHGVYFLWHKLQTLDRGKGVCNKRDLFCYHCWPLKKKKPFQLLHILVNCS